jgi:hypothetical protein
MIKASLPIHETFLAILFAVIIITLLLAFIYTTISGV